MVVQFLFRHNPLLAKRMNIQISENCTVHEVRAWDMAAIRGFRLTRGSGFEPGAHGLALAKLASHLKGELEVQCSFAEPETAEEFEATLLSGAFGISLIRHAKQVTFGLGHTPASEKLGGNLARFYRERGGLLGLGQNCSLICVDPGHSLPSKLRAYARHEDRDFPLDRSGFHQLLSSMAQLLGFQYFSSSSTVSDLTSFVFECFVNSQEHGQSILNTNSVERQGVRALMIDKVVIKSTTKHNSLSEEMQNYIARCSEAAGGKLGLGLVCMTVADQGDGIQHTLPPDMPNETPIQRFARAFTADVTRKPKGEIKRGRGLSNALSAAHRMRARIEIHSSGVHFVQDFSLEDSKYPQLDVAAIVEAPSTKGCGTVVSIWVPEFESGLDQRELFDRKNLLPVA